jgi:hypothetical protein
MHDLRYRMVARGVGASPIQPHWCALRPSESVQLVLLAHQALTLARCELILSGACIEGA